VLVWELYGGVHVMVAAKGELLKHRLVLQVT
jgi:hypothetical protein